MTCELAGGPHYHDMIMMLHGAKKKYERCGTYVGQILHEIYKERFLKAQIPSRPCRLLTAAERIAAPLQKGSHEVNDKYLDMLWIPWIRPEACKLVQIQVKLQQ